MDNQASGELTLAIIPARGNSKGIPGKNIKLLHGKPLIEYSFRAAQKSNVFDRILLSTDSEEIARVGRELGIDVPFLRPANIALDNSPVLELIDHVMEFLEKSNWIPKYIVLLQPTAPLRKPETISKAVSLLKSNDQIDSVVSVIDVPADLRPHYVMKITDAGYLTHFLEDGKKVHRRQDAPPAYARSGVVYAFKYSSFKKYHNIYGEKCFPLVLSDDESVNIDSLEDWKLAERLLNRTN